MTSTLEKQILMGEDSGLELKVLKFIGKKVASPDAHDLADELAAAANTEGMSLVLGVNDKTLEIEGIPLERLDGVETWIRNICNDSIKPALLAGIHKRCLVGKDGLERYVLVVDIAKSLFVHKSPHGYFYRIGSSKREMSPDYLARLFQQRSQTRLICFDEQGVGMADVKALQEGLYGRFRTKLSPADNFEFLQKLHFVVRDESGSWRPTVGGLLMASEHPEEFLPSAFIQAVCYRGKERTAAEQVDARDLTGPLDRQIAEACRFVSRNMRVAAVKNPARIDIPQYAINAVFEAVVNAVAHRDYSISGAKIRLHMFADRIEIYSPGALPNSLTIEEIGERQFSRNELLCTCLSRCPLTDGFTDALRSHIMDRRGEGVPVILGASRRHSGKDAVYQLINQDELKLTIPSAPIDDPKELAKLVETLSNERRLSGQRGTMNEGIALIRRLALENPTITQAEMARACGVSRTCIANWLRRAQTIRRVGGDYGGKWVVLEP